MKNLLPLRFAVTLTALAFTGFSAITASAANYAWTQSSGNTAWTSTTAWTPNGTPGASDNITGNTTVATLLVNGNHAINNWTHSANNWTVTSNATAATIAVGGTLSNTGAALTLRDSSGVDTLSLTINTMNIDGGSVRLGLNNSILTGFTATTANIGAGTFSIYMAEGGTATVKNLNLTNAAAIVNVRYNSSGTTPGTGTLLVNSLNGTTGTIRALDASTNVATGILNIQSTGSASYSGLIVDRGSGTNGVMQVVKAGAGTQVFGGSNTYTGGTRVNAGTLLLAHNNAAGSGGVVIDGGNLQIASGNTISNSISFDAAGGRISGGGTVGSAVSLTNTNQVLAPGESPGILNFAVSETWDAFTYQWDLNDWTGTTAGTNFDQIAITGSLNLSGDSAGSYILDITSLTLSNVEGLVANFSETAKSWTILTTTTGITGFDAAFWNILDANFSSDPAATGNWTLALGNGDNDLVLSYSVVPEPRAAVLAGAGLGLLLWRLRRVVRRRKL